MGRYTEYCGQDSRDVAGVPVDDIQRAVSPTDAQRAALDDLGNASVQAAQIVKAACPRDVSLTPVGRMQAMEQRVQSMLDAARVMRPALEKFYSMLTDEQKSRFNALGQQTQSQQSQSAGAPAANGPSSPATNCSNRAIPDWPTAVIERSVRPTPAQQVNLTTLQNAAAKAKDILQASCPSEMPATALARISAIEQRLQTILAAVQTVRGPLNDFYSSLSDEQKAQFNAIGRTRPARQG
jgi:ABC-type transporter MlaC component